MTKLLTETTSSTYVPGVCNINSQEIAARRRIGYGWSVIFIVGLGVLLWVEAPVVVRSILLLPAAIAASGFLQARHKFCVGYAAAYQEHAGERGANINPVEDPAARAKDKKKASSLNRRAFLYGAVITVATFLL